MRISIKWKQSGPLVAILFLGYMPVLFGRLNWWPHDVWVQVLCGPIAVVIDAAWMGAAANRFSRWWLLALIAPLWSVLVLLTASQ